MIDPVLRIIGGAEDEAAQLEETSLMHKDRLATPETMHVFSAVNKDTSPTTARRGKDETITTPISSILTTMTKNTTIAMPRNNRSILSTISRLDLLTSPVMTKLN